MHFYLKGAVCPVSAGCFYVGGRTFRSWTSGDGDASTWQPEGQCQGVGLYPLGDRAPQSLASDSPAGSAPDPGVCQEEGDWGYRG